MSTRQVTFSFDRSLLEESLTEARSDVVKHWKLPNDWWPVSNSQASIWSHYFFLEVTSRIHAESAGNIEIFCNSGVSKGAQVAVEIFNYPHNTKALMVDFAAAEIESHEPFLVTGESEMSPRESMEFSVGKGYLWDLFKLLMVPSPVRIFMARVGGTRLQPVPNRVAILTDKIKAMAKRFRGGILPDEVKFAAVIIPATKRDFNAVKILWSNDTSSMNEATISPKFG